MDPRGMQLYASLLKDLPLRMHSLGWSYNDSPVFFFISHFSMKTVSLFLTKRLKSEATIFILHGFVVVHDFECS